jgi:hypothetical protein
MFKGILNSMKEDNGQSSSTRFILYGVTFTLMVVYMTHNIIAAIKGLDYVDFPMNTVVVLGIVLTGKVTQKFVEYKGKIKDKVE